MRQISAWLRSVPRALAKQGHRACTMCLDGGRRSVVWRGQKSPTKSIAKRFGIPADIVRTVIHNVKDREGLGGSDNIIIYDNADIEDEFGNWLGNMCDEPGVHCDP